MIWYIFGTVVVVFGGVALLIFLALSSNRGASTQPQPQSQPQPVSQQESDWEKWGKRFGWVFFVYVVWDLCSKFVSPRVPNEWKEWVPSFSWNTFEILVLVVGVAVLWTKWKKQTNTTGGGTGTSGGAGGNNPPALKKVPPEEKHTAGKVLLFAIFLVVGICMAILPKPHQDIIPIPPGGQLYIPLYGLVFMAVWAAFIDLFWLVFDEVDGYALYFVAPLFLGLIMLGCGLRYDIFVPIHIDPNIVFAPFTNDILVDTGMALGAAFVVFLGVFFGSDRDETKIIVIFVLMTVWLVQYPVFRSMMHGVFG